MCVESHHHPCLVAGKTVVAVVGNSHVYGMQRHWADPRSFDQTYCTLRSVCPVRPPLSQRAELGLLCCVLVVSGARVLMMADAPRETRLNMPSNPTWKYLVAPRFLSPRWILSRKFSIVIVVVFFLFAYHNQRQQRLYGDELSRRLDRHEGSFWSRSALYFLGGAGVIASASLLASPWLIRNSFARFDKARQVWRQVSHRPAPATSGISAPSNIPPAPSS
jgi:hypothetical protein